LFVAAFFLIYVGVCVGNVLMISLRQIITPGHLMGRMNAAMRTLMYGLGALGGAASGIVGVAAGLHAALWVFAIAAAVCMIPVIFSPIARLREMPEPTDNPTALSGAPA
jgi:cyanate permease